MAEVFGQVLVTVLDESRIRELVREELKRAFPVSGDPSEPRLKGVLQDLIREEIARYFQAEMEALMEEDYSTQPLPQEEEQASKQ